MTMIRVLGALKDTVQAPQWGLLLLVLGFGLISNLGAAPLLSLAGSILAILLCLWAAGALGYDGGNLLKFLFSFTAIGGRQLVLATVLLGLALGIGWMTSQAQELATMLVQVMPASLAPRPDESLVLTLLICLAFTVFSVVAIFVRRRALALVLHDPIATMNRRDRRASGVTKHDFDDFKKSLAVALESKSYWVEASLVLGLATVAVVPGALGWPWLWGVALGVVLPMFVLSVRSRASPVQDG